MERTGVVLYHGFQHGDEVASYGRVAEDSGYDSIWVTERFGHEEAFSVLGVLASVTRRISMGLGVANPYSRHIGMLAMASVTLDRLSRGRFILGMGRSDRAVVEDLMGLDYSHSLLDLSNAITGLRLAWGRSDTGIQTSEAQSWLHIAPTQSDIPIYMAAIGPRALRLAGEKADGVLLNTYSPLGYVRWAVEQIRDGARAVGRDPSSIDIACMMVVRPEQQLEYRQMKARICRHFHESGGISRYLIRDTPVTLAEVQRINELMSTDKHEDAIALVPDELIEEYYLVGSYQNCADRIRDYRAAGVTNPLLLPRLENLKADLEGMAKYL